jgi:hypothetical protein
MGTHPRLREDAGLDLNEKTKILVKGLSAAEAHTATQRLLTADPSSCNGNPLVDVRTGARHADGRLSGLWSRHGL